MEGFMTDTKEIISCPACGKEMKKVLLSGLNLNIDVCVDGCGGIFFDNRELKIVNENADQVGELVDALEGKTFAEVDDAKERICPACGAKMVKNKTNNVDMQNNDFVVVDECYQCGGKFLDHGELERFKHKQSINSEEKAKADMQYLYSQVGISEGSIERDMEKFSPLKKIFMKLMGY